MTSKKIVRPQIKAAINITILILVTLLVCLQALKYPFFSLDDYRYLAELKNPAGINWLKASIVENRWDNLWWIADGSYVRFFRPLVIFSYWLDYQFYGLNPAGFVTSNIIYHLLCTVLVYLLLLKISGNTAGTFLAALAFGLSFSHFENIFYIAGRTDTLAALFILLGLVVFIYAPKRHSLQNTILTGLILFLALLGKEYALILLPVFVVSETMLFDKKLSELLKDRAAIRFYTVNFAFVILYFTLRYFALGEAGSGSRPFPYFYMPWREGFLERTFAVFLQYITGLSLGTYIKPFLNDASSFFSTVPLWQIIISTIWFIFLLTFALKKRTGIFFAVFFVVFLFPLLPLYSTARYLYLPSVGYCGLLALVFNTLQHRQQAFRMPVLALVIILFLLIPAFKLYIVLEDQPRQMSQPETRAERYASTFKTKLNQLINTAPVYILDFPGSWYEIQFLPAVLKVLVPELKSNIFILTRFSERSPDAITGIKVLSENTIEIYRDTLPLYDPEPQEDFDEQRLTPGESIKRPGYTFTVLETKDDKVIKARVTFPVTLRELNLVRLKQTENQKLTVDLIAPDRP
ncbi:MAG: hypothetical protein D6719_00190 [Candidatus Dadabacteria bacterium]|nr:MAG: hypothetical protein D6719_00190 [Candidatus Dadabacteria bacterium]